MSKFNAEKAVKLANKVKEPQTVEEVLKHIKASAKLGFCNASTVITNKKLAMSMEKKLGRLGFRVVAEDGGLGGWIVHFEW